MRNLRKLELRSQNYRIGITLRSILCLGRGTQKRSKEQRQSILPC